MATLDSLSALSTNPIVREILVRLEASSPGCFLVGGAVRDVLLGRGSPVDLDVAAPDDGFLLAMSVAEDMGDRVTFVPLDEDRGIGRLVIGRADSGTVDVARFRGRSIHDDLRSRDFTINAVAVAVADLLAARDAPLLDPVGGISDMDGCLVRACSNESFLDDPLRVLRAFRFSTDLDFAITSDTLEMIGAALPLLSKVSTERLRDEFMAILASSRASPTLREMDDFGVLPALFPEIEAMKDVGQNPFHHLDVWGHTIESVRQVEDLEHGLDEVLPGAAPMVRDYLAGEPVAGRPRLALLKLAALFHDAGKPECRREEPDGRVRFIGHEKVSHALFEAAGKRLKLASREIALVGEWIRGHMRTLVFTGKSVSARTVLRLRRRYGRDLIGLLLLFLADLAASRGPARTPEEYDRALDHVRHALRMLEEAEAAPPVRFLNGKDLMDRFGLSQGPLVGEVLSMLAELQDLGRISSHAEAVGAVEKYLAGKLKK